MAKTKGGSAVEAIDAELADAQANLEALQGEKAKQQSLDGQIKDAKAAVNRLTRARAAVLGEKANKGEGRLPKADVYAKLSAALGDKTLKQAEIAKATGLSVGVVRTALKREDSPFATTEDGGWYALAA